MLEYKNGMLCTLGAGRDWIKYPPKASGLGQAAPGGSPLGLFSGLQADNISHPGMQGSIVEEKQRSIRLSRANTRPGLNA